MKFFLIRAFIYTSFLLIPTLLQTELNLHPFTQSAMMIFYIIFMIGQWFLLGKEVDHRFNIFFLANSSFDRVVYRLVLGMAVMAIYFNVIDYLPAKWTSNLFWLTWVVLGTFYSWPTRGKIIQETVTAYFSEFKFLDRFEKTLLILIITTFFISLPELPSLTNPDALKMFFDPLEKISAQFWIFLDVNYLPFKKYPSLFRLGWSMHFYFVGLGMFLVTTYALLRYFVSRRLSILGIFALVSSWPYTKLLAANSGASLLTTYSVLWIWSLIWLTRSSSYRVGLYWGLMFFWGVLINHAWAWLAIFQLILTYFFFLPGKTDWFKRQLLRYAIPGLLLSFFVAYFNRSAFNLSNVIDANYFSALIKIMNKKAFFSIAYLGLPLLIAKLIWSNRQFFRQINIDTKRIQQLFILLLILFIYSLTIDSYLLKGFSILWPTVLFSLVPLEILFQSISRLRSGRNMIYLIYIIICLLDSHLEVRLKVLLRMFS
ncbi:MAG TPA: hypothetical protein VI754_11490 [Bacteriovoracaceae bacterium]|nr:hypothetical protein [Bacteriovoracaceae bacterium]